jgi:uncharacterized membrane protein
VTRNVLLGTTEGRLLLVALLLTGALLTALGIGWWVAPERTLIYAAMTGLNLLIGRAAGMSFGYANGLGHAEVIPWNIIVETLQVLVVFPLFALGWTHLIDSSRWSATMTRLRNAAEAQRGAIQRYGIAGLFVFVFTPFWMTGPVVGAIVGLLIGLRTRTNLAVVLAGTYVAIGVWALLLNELNKWAAAYNRFAPFALVIALALIALSGRLIRRLPQSHR